MQPVMVSVVLGTYNRLEFLKLTIENIRKELKRLKGSAGEIIVVDGGSTDGTLEWLILQKDVIAIVQHNRGSLLGKDIQQRSWGYFMNLAFKCAHGKYVCMVSDDCLLIPYALRNGINQFEREISLKKKIGALAFYWRHWNKEKKYRVGVPMGSHMYVNHGLYLNNALKRIDYIDENSYMFYFADIDLCFRLWQHGYIVIGADNSFVEHYPYANLQTRAQNNKQESVDFKAFLDKWQKVHNKLTNHNISDLKKCDFVDSYNTAECYKKIYDNVVMEGKRCFQKSGCVTLYVSTMQKKAAKFVKSARGFFLRND